MKKENQNKNKFEKSRQYAVDLTPYFCKFSINNHFIFVLTGAVPLGFIFWFNSLKPALLDVAKMTVEQRMEVMSWIENFGILKAKLIWFFSLILLLSLFLLFSWVFGFVFWSCIKFIRTIFFKHRGVK